MIVATESLQVLARPAARVQTARSAAAARRTGRLDAVLRAVRGLTRQATTPAEGGLRGRVAHDWNVRALPRRKSGLGRARDEARERRSDARPPLAERAPARKRVAATVATPRPRRGEDRRPRRGEGHRSRRGKGHSPRRGSSLATYDPSGRRSARHGTVATPSRRAGKHTSGAWEHLNHVVVGGRPLKDVPVQDPETCRLAFDETCPGAPCGGVPRPAKVPYNSRPRPLLEKPHGRVSPLLARGRKRAPARVRTPPGAK